MASSHPFPTPLLHSPVNEKYDASLGRRTSATLQDNTAWNYSYNQRSEITSAIRKNASNVTQNNMRYVFDNIGNRTSSYEDATSKTYDANSLNQYTEIDVTGGSSVCPLYDDDGNMTQFDSSTYTYDAENRLICAENGNTRCEYTYDALGRRVAKKTYQNNTLTKHQRFIYNGLKLLRICNAYYSYGFIPAFTFLWQPFGPDVPLAMWKYSDNTLFAYLVDANKNVLGLYVPSGTRVATYLYGPFGQKLSESGNAASSNPLQFSSEQFDADLGLVYYNFRYYFPAIGKWLTKDPIGEEGGWNLYAFCRNDAVNTWDRWGLEGCCGPDITEKLQNLLTEVQKRYLILTEEEKCSLCDNIIEKDWGWDIIELYIKGGPAETNPKDRTCEKTFTYGGGCYKAWAINYALWGWINRLCKRTYFEAESLVRGYRAPMFELFRKDIFENEDYDFGTQTRIDWTAFGYLGLNIIAVSAPEQTLRALSLTKKGDAELTWEKSKSMYQCAPSSNKYKKQLRARLRITKDKHLFVNDSGQSSIEITKGIKNPIPQKIPFPRKKK